MMAKVIGDLEGFRFPVEEQPGHGQAHAQRRHHPGGLNTNSVPDRARITLDTRTVPGIDHGHLCRSLESLLAPRGARVRKIVDTPRTSHRLGRRVGAGGVRCVRSAPRRAPGAAHHHLLPDGADLKRGFGGPPAVILGPGKPTLAHQTDEWCSMRRMEQSVDVFRTLMLRWCGA